MNNLNQLHHRRAFGHRPRQPQTGFVPTAIFGSFPFQSTIPDPESLVPIVIGGVTQIVPPVISSILELPSSSTKVSTSTPSRPTSISSTSTSTTSTSASHSTSTSSTSSTSTSQTVTSKTSVSPVIVAPHTKTSLVVQTISTTANTHPTSTAAASNGLSTGAVAGGIVAAIIAIIALIVVIVFFLRRSRKRDDEITDFSPQVFRRSAILISDPPTHEDTIARGFNPRPPTMFEKRLASPAPTFGTLYNAPPPPAYNNHGNEYSGGISEKHAEFGYNPQQVGNMNYNAPPANPNYPMFPLAIHNQSPFPPVHGPISPFREQQQDQQSLVMQPANVNGDPSWGGATYPVLTRQPSAHSSSDGHSGQVPPGLPLQRDSAPTSDYVDLDRSSVSPYQAAQYVEISRRLNTDIPQGLQVQDAEKSLPPIPPQSREVSPFADPESVPPSPGAQFAINRKNLDSSPRPESVDTISSATSNTLDFPLPPSPAYTVSSRYRVDSTPPTLPEINVESRGSTTRYSGLRNVVTIPSGPDGLNQKPPTTPSPLGLSPQIQLTQEVEETSFSAAVLGAQSSAPSPSSPVAPAVPAVPTETKKRTTTYSMYDPEDAYGGI